MILFKKRWLFCYNLSKPKLLNELSKKYKSDSSFVGGRHRSALSKIYGDITSKSIKVLIGYCSICNGKKQMTISDDTMQAKGLGSSFKNLGKISAKAGKN